ERLTARYPHRFEMWVGRGEVLRQLGRHTEAARQFETALKLKPNDAELACSYASTLLFLGRADEAIEVTRRAVAGNPRHSDLSSLAGTVLLYASGAAREETLEGHLRFARIVSAGVKEGPPLQNSREPERPLRIGIISAELRQHSVGAFMESILANRGSNAV